MFKIKSKFYVIYGDGVPIYVGFTSRTVRQRFLEHKKSKDFSDFDEVGVEELKEDELDFDFCWDYDIVENEANEVSQREAELVKKFGTQNSEFQKANGGGVVWNHIKYFVLSNKDNPRYRGMNGKEIHEYLENRKKEMTVLSGFVGRIRYPSKIVLGNFICGIRYPSEVILDNFTRRVRYPSRVILGSFIGSDNYLSEVILSNFTRYVNYPSKSILSNFARHVNYPMGGILGGFISRIRYPSRIFLGNFISGVNYPSKIILKNFISSVNNPSKVILYNFTKYINYSSKMILGSFIYHIEIKKEK